MNAAERHRASSMAHSQAHPIRGREPFPPTRLCTCGHVFVWHRGGSCRVVQGCGCQAFIEEPLVVGRDGSWMRGGRVKRRERRNDGR